MSSAADVISYLGTLTVPSGDHQGDPFMVLPFQRRLIRGIFRAGDGDVVFTAGRGSGKTAVTGALAASVIDPAGPLHFERAEIVCAAASMPQAKIVFEDVLAYLEAKGYDLSDRRLWRKNDSPNVAMLQYRPTKARIRCVPCNANTAHGLRPAPFAILDEPARWPKHLKEKMFQALRTSAGKSPMFRGLIVMGTRDPDDQSFMRRMERDAAYVQVHAARPGDNPMHLATARRAIPSLDHLPSLKKRVLLERDEARRSPDSLQAYRSLRLNLAEGEVAADGVFVTADDWQTAVAIGRPDRPRGPYVLGIDAGSSDAMSAFAAYHQDGSLDAYALLPELPDLRTKGLKDGVGARYQKMATRNELLQRGRRVADLGAGLEEALHRWGRPACIVVDSWRYNDIREAAEEVRFPHVEIIKRRGGFFDGHQDVVAARKAILSGLVRPPESLLLTSALSEARLVYDNSGNSKLASKSEGGRRRRAKDDACSASVLAIAVGYRAWHAGAPSRPLRYFRVPART